jgi:ATP-binding cassette subfamily B protein
MAPTTAFPSASTRDTLAYCWRQFGDQRRTIITAWVVMAGAVVVADVVCPLLFATVLSRVATLPAHGGVEEWHRFGPPLLGYAVAGLVAMAGWRVAGWLDWGATLRAFAAGIDDGYRHLLRLSDRWHQDHPAGEVISSLGNFSWAFVELVDVFTWGLLPVAVIVLSALAVLAVVAWPAAVAIGAMIAAFVWVMARRLPRVRRAAQEFEDLHSRANGVVADTVTNLVAVRSAATEADERRRVAGLLDRSVAADLRARSIFMKTQLQLETSIVAGTFLALLAGTTMAVHHWASTAAVYLILYYAAQVALGLQQSFEHIRSLARAMGRTAKFTAIAAEDVEIEDRPGAPDLVVTTPTVDFDGVTFGYGSGRPLFSELRLSVAPGEHVALVGPSGSGKSTLSKLLLRLMDVDGGSVRVSGADVREVTLASLRRQVAYVPQDPQLLHRTIAENICYGSRGDPDRALVAEVGRAAHVEEFVFALPEGYDTVVGERGLKLSGGQRQRVAIAQAMAKRAPVLILDEATSALDSESEHLVQEALWRLMDGCTALVIAHRLSTVAHMDRIVVLDGGRIVEEGRHDQLLAADGLYRRLWSHQSGGFLAGAPTGDGDGVDRAGRAVSGRARAT